MKITYDQAHHGFIHAFDCVEQLRQDHESVRPPWIDVDFVETTDMNMLSVRFPGNCRLSDKATEMVREDNPDHDGYAIGVFVVLIDNEGIPVFARHTAAGALPVNRDGTAAHR
jgi:hypothetical protein